MNPTPTTVLSSLLVLSAIQSVYAQDKTYVPPKPVGSAGLVNDWLREQSEGFKPWDLGGQFRARFELKENFGVAGNTDFRDEGVDNDNSYLLLRSKAHVGYSPCSWFTAFAEGRDSRSFDDDRSPDPESDEFDLHQGYVWLGDLKEFPLAAKVGRQELSYGDERLIGAFDWNNIGRVFDAAKVRFENPQLWVDGFVSRVVVPNDNNFNEANDYDWFSGVYASSKALAPYQESQLYFLSRNVSAGSSGPGLPSPRDIYTLGVRLKSMPGQLKNWDYSLEMAGQVGSINFDGRRQDHQAFALHVAGGYTFTNVFATPRVGLEYNYASGDDDPTDELHETFENLFPTNHKFYGYMDLFSWQNIHNARLSTAYKPLKNLNVTIDFHAFWLAETEDFFYQVNGAPRTGAGTGYGRNAGHGSYVGSEVDLIATYTIKPYAYAQAGYGHFFAGEYVRDSLRGVGGATDADYVYLQVLLNF